MRFKDVTGATHEATPSEVPFRPTIYVCVEHDEKLLMLIDERSGKWELPGGGLEVGEEVEEGAKREVKEETGYSVTVKPLPFHLMKEMFYFRTCQEYCHALILFHEGTLMHEEQEALSPTEEEKIIEVKWIPFDKLDELEIIDHHQEAIKRFLEKRAP
jgi:8-oxo-dGTP diphosphatase